MVMRWLNRHLDHAGRERIEAAVKAAEAGSAGEIIPVVVRRSAPYGHVALLAAATLLAAIEASRISWGLVLPWGTQPLLVMALDFLSAALAGWLLAKSAAVRHWLTPAKDRALAVHRAAEAAFHHLNLHRARKEAGVLLYVSLEERRAVVLAGKGIAELAGEEHWKAACAALIEGAAKKDLATGFENAVARVAEVLAQHHPKTADSGEAVLSQRLHILHENF
jgi:putative membrane protein